MSDPRVLPRPSDIAYEQSGRGLKYYEDIPTRYGHTVAVYESSSAFEPHLWLKIEAGEGCAIKGHRGLDISAHLTVDQARRLRDTLDAAIANHYQGSAGV